MEPKKTLGDKMLYDFSIITVCNNQAILFKSMD